MRKRVALPIAILAGMLLGSGSAAAQNAHMAPGHAADPNLRQAMRKLWADHVIWTRDYIIAAVAGAPDATAALNRLMKNQEDIGNAIVPYYGAEAGAKLTDLLKQHISQAGEVVAAAKANDSAKLAAADRRWHDNAAEIATFLSSANPNWARAALLDMLCYREGQGRSPLTVGWWRLGRVRQHEANSINQHLALTTQEATARLKQQWNEDIVKFDEIFNQAMMMADALAEGNLKQHPRK